MESMQVKRDLSLAKNIIESNDSFLTDIEKYFLRIYPFLTENYKGYMPNMTEKSLLTVGSSGDQILNAMLNDASKVSCMDINRFSKYYFDLKKAAILKLSFEDYLGYFYCGRKIENENTFSPNVYKKISKVLGTDTKYFWDELYDRYSALDIRTNLFIRDEVDPVYMARYNEYLNEDKYKELKKKLDKTEVSFVCSDVTDSSSFRKIPKRSFDYIMLSDVFQYYINDQKSINKLRKIVSTLKELIKDDGEIYLLYKYYPLLSQLAFKDIYFIKTHLLLSTEVKKFDSCASLQRETEDENNGRESNDAVLVYKK